MDNYISMVSGQSPAAGHPVRLQRRVNSPGRHQCQHPDQGHNENVRSGLHARPTPASPAAPTRRTALNGCTYPSQVPTLFNQLDAAGETWKGYAQDLGNQPGREDAACGGPGTCGEQPEHQPDLPQCNGQPSPSRPASPASPAPRQMTSTWPSTSRSPWFESLDRNQLPGSKHHPGADQAGPGWHGLRRGNHVANLDSCEHRGLFKDLQKESTTPAFSWITPEQLQRRP